MAIIQLTSENPDFSYIIQKNPATGMILKSVRKGKAFGWFSDSNTYNVFFKDAENEVSYHGMNNSEFEYLDASRYNSPMAPINLITDFFSTTLKKWNEKDVEGFQQVFMANLVHVEHRRYLEFFETHFTDFQLEYKELAYKNYQIIIRTKRTVYELVNFVNTLFLFLSLISDVYVEVSNETIEKYVRSINVINAPFYIRYLFVRNVLVSKEKFFKYKGSLEDHAPNQIMFSFGNTAIQRRDWIQNQLSFDKPIVDIGCGEGAYAMPFSKKISDFTYHAIDIDENVRQKLAWKLEKKQVENVVLYESISDYLEAVYGNGDKVDVLMTEVVEHMELEAATDFVQFVFDTVDFNKMIITTPNADFNTFYALNHFRHHDHKWEMSELQFKDWMTQLAGSKYDTVFYGIGDVVDGISTTLGVILTRKDEVTC